jgi:hypothetical protein
VFGFTVMTVTSYGILFSKRMTGIRPVC